MEMKLPFLGDGVDSATVLSIMVKPGDTVKKEDTLLELETEKAVAPIPSDFDGTILYNYDIDTISKKLKHPPKEPDYRKSRKHDDFLSNIPLKKLTIISLFSQYFNSSEMQFKSIKDILEIEFNKFVKKHHDKNWIYKR